MKQEAPTSLSGSSSQVYTSSSKDGYRMNVRKKKDGDKIAFIQKHLE